jgi:hypothetical protein
LTTLRYKDHGFIRFVSERTGETLFEIKMFKASILIWGAHYRPSEFQALLAEDGASMRIEGMLCDRVGPVVTFADSIEIASSFRVEVGDLPAEFDGTWSPHRT